MKIGIIGTHGTGKTTLCNDFVKKYPEYFLIPEIARIFGIEKIENKTIDVQWEMLHTQLDIEKHHKNFIADRTVLDFGIYGINEELLDTCINIASNRYDLLFYIPIKFPVVNDGFRNTDERHRKTIDDLFIRYAPIGTITLNKLSTEDRIIEIESYL